MEEAENAIVQNSTTKKSGKKWWLIGIVIVLFLCLIAGGIAALFGFGVFSFYSSVSAPVGPIKDQLKALNNNDFKTAYDYCSNEFKNETSYDDLVGIAKGNPQIFKSKSSSFNEVNIKNGVATVSGTITGKDGTVTPMVYQLVKENGVWKILNFRKGYPEKEEEE